MRVQFYLLHLVQFCQHHFLKGAYFLHAGVPYLANKMKDKVVNKYCWENLDRTFSLGEGQPGCLKAKCHGLMLHIHNMILFLATLLLAQKLEFKILNCMEFLKETILPSKQIHIP